MTVNASQPFRLALDQILVDTLNRDPKSPIAMTREGIVFPSKISSIMPIY